MYQNLSQLASVTHSGRPQNNFASPEESCAGERCHTCSYAADLHRASITPLETIETSQCINAHELKQNENSLMANLNLKIDYNYIN